MAAADRSDAGKKKPPPDQKATGKQSAKKPAAPSPASKPIPEKAAGEPQQPQRSTTDKLFGPTSNDPPKKSRLTPTKAAGGRMPSSGPMQTPGAASRGRPATPQRPATSRPRIKDAAKKALPGGNVKIPKPAKLGAKAAKRAKQAGSAAGRQQLRNDAREGIKNAGKKAFAVAKHKAKQVAKRAAKEALKQGAKAAWQALVACVASVVCAVILGIAVLLLGVVAVVGLQVLFTGGVNLDLNEMVEEQRAARQTAVAADGGDGTREQLADLDLLETQWRLGGGGGTSPTGVLERWTSAAAGPEYVLATADTYNDRALACDRLLDGYTPEQDLATADEIRAEIDVLLAETDADICGEMWAAAVAWTRTLRAAAANIDGVDTDSAADLVLADLAAGGYPIRDTLQAITLATSELALHHTTGESSGRVAMAIALWSASGFATSDPDDGFVELYYASRRQSDIEAAARYRGTRAATFAASGLSAAAERRAALRVDNHRRRAEGVWLTHYQHIADLRATILARYAAAVALAEEEGTDPPAPPVLPPYPPAWTTGWPTYCGDPGGLYGRNAVSSRSWTAAVGIDNADRTAAAVDTDKLLMAVECPLPATVDVCSEYRLGATVPTFGEYDKDAAAPWCVEIVEIETALEAQGIIGYLVWSEKWERNHTEGYTIGDCTPATSDTAPTDSWILSFCANLIQLGFDGHAQVTHGFAQTEWVGAPPKPQPPQFGQLLALFVDWESNTSHNVPAAQKAFAVANLQGWMPPFGVPAGDRNELSTGDPGRLGCPRLWRVVTRAAARAAGMPTDADSVDNECDGPTYEQMRQWGWTHPYQSACPDPAPLSATEADDVDIVDLSVTLPAGGQHILRVAPCMVPTMTRMYDLLAVHEIHLAAVSTYRDWEEQSIKYAGFVAAGGVDADIPPVASPGHSRHNMGLAIDFDCFIDPDPGDLMPECWRWLDYYAFYYGLVNLPVEEWHWSADGH